MDLSELRQISQIQESFLNARRDELWIIDQHVAHERILFPYHLLLSIELVQNIN